MSVTVRPTYLQSSRAPSAVAGVLDRALEMDMQEDRAVMEGVCRIAQLEGNGPAVKDATILGDGCAGASGVAGDAGAAGASSRGAKEEDSPVFLDLNKASARAIDALMATENVQRSLPSESPVGDCSSYENGSGGGGRGSLAYKELADKYAELQKVVSDKDALLDVFVKCVKTFTTMVEAGVAAGDGEPFVKVNAKELLGKVEDLLFSVNYL